MFGLSTVKLVVIAIAAAALIGLGVKAYHGIKESGRQEEREKVAKERAAEKERTDKLNEETDHAWQSKVDELQARVDSMLVAPGPAIRLCKPAPKVRLPDAPVVANETPAEARPDLQAGPDIRGQLILYAADSERCRSQLTELQEWITAVSGQ